jgi:hypothetical protein
MNVSRTQAGAQNIQLHRLLADWGQGTSDAILNEGSGVTATPGDATWLHRFHNTQLWKTPGGELVESASAGITVAGEGSYAWGSTAQMVADVQGWLDNPAGNFGWLLRGSEGPRQTAKRFDSMENTTTGSRPMLVIEYRIN